MRKKAKNKQPKRDGIRRMSENVKVTKAAGVVGMATLSSRILGFVRDMVVAVFFGAGVYSDAFIAAFRIPNLLRRLFAEGSLSIAFVPVFTDCLNADGKEEAFDMARSAMRLLSVLLTGITLAGIFFSPQIVHAIAYGFTDNPEQYELTVLLTRIMFPYVICICLVALSMGILNALGHFAAPALAPVFLNLAMIAFVCTASFFSSKSEDRIVALAVGVVAGGVLQLALQVPFLIQKGFRFWQKAPFFHPGLKKIGQMLLPAVFGAGVYQVNMLVSTFLASLLPEGSISTLYYADRLVQFPLGIFAISIATAILPSLSRQAAADDIDGLKDTFSFGLKLVFYIMLPSMAGLIILREPIISLLFQRGAFDTEAVHMTATALLFYSAGLWAFAAVRIVIPVFYAFKDTKTPVRMAMISIVANIFFSVILMGPMAHGGLALATSLSSIVNLGLLFWALRMRLGRLNWKGILISLFKSAGGAGFMGIVVYAAAFIIFPEGKWGTPGEVLGLCTRIFLGILAYVGFSLVVKSAELDSVLAIVRRGKNFEY